jgi:hypothetical protein
MINAQYSIFNEYMRRLNQNWNFILKQKYFSKWTGEDR